MKYTALLVLVFVSMNVFAQENESRKHSLSLAGYIVEMPWVTYYNDFRTREFTNLVHNRLNAKWEYESLLEAKFELRNRLFTGDQVKNNPYFTDQLTNDETIDLSHIWFNDRASVFVSNIERLSLEYRGKKWNTRLGRQRINWAMANFWNPNDIFNYYNILDFDYIERPGSDALRLQHMIGDFSNIEGVVAFENNDTKGAIKYSTNYKKYDLQFIGGLLEKGNTITTGLGWAGSISSVGFRGEMQYYFTNDSTNDFNVSVEADYMFKNGIYAAVSMLYNGNGLNEPINVNNPLVFQTSSANLMPAKWNTLFLVSKQFTPLFSGNLNIIYSPKVNLLILFPTISYNIFNNFDLSLVWQSFFTEMESFEAVSHSSFLRGKWSF